MSGYTIEWAENPLASKIILGDEGRLRMRLGIAKDAVYTLLAACNLAKQHQEFHWLDQADEIGKDVDAYIDKYMQWCEPALQSIHCGDCTCVPAMCEKCFAEQMLGFYTTEGLGKHEGHVLQSAFSTETTTIEEAIAYIDRPIQPTWGTPKEWEGHMARWKDEHERAKQWLSQYLLEHILPMRRRNRLDELLQLLQRTLQAR